ncbi:MAG TPA: hypothetical protein VGN47_01955 [Blastococcus sp.]|jgi:hypothetical protein|nr:hypothetical protein [Blastococcus sp.]
MRNRLRSVVVVVLAVAAAVLAVPGAASATTTTTLGFDVSYPQCGTALPRGQAFGIVGVNGGLSTKTNPCLSDQLTWAWKSSGVVAAQPKAQLYLNTANPGEVRTQITTWPTSGSTPYGACDGSNSSACSWQYGYERAQNSVVSFFKPAAQAARVDSQPAQYIWWLDVETSNTWQSGSSAALARNRATLEGMTAYLTAAPQSGKVGLYSTPQQWSQIVGSVPASSNLAGRNSWLAGATSVSGARAACTRPNLAPGGKVTLGQYVQGGLDHDRPC